MTIRLKELARLTHTKLLGDGDCLIHGVSPIHNAQKGHISFVRNQQFKTLLSESKASAVILPPQLEKGYRGHALLTNDPYLAYAKVVSLFHPEISVQSAFIHDSASIADTVKLPNTLYIGPHVVIEDNVTLAEGISLSAACYIGAGSSIGSNTVLKAHVTLAPNTQIGNHCLLHAGAVLGADGFGFAPENKTWFKIPQIGNVIVGDEVEIGANTTIDCAAMGSTQIKRGVKLDNLIQIGHNVIIGEHTAMAACSCVAGSTKIGARCQIGGAAAISGHLTIVDDVIITGMTMVIHSIKQRGVYSSGVIAEQNRRWRKNAIRYSQLDKMARRLNHLEKQMAKLLGS